MLTQAQTSVLASRLLS